MEKKKFINSHQQTKINHKGIFMANSFHIHDVQLSTGFFFLCVCTIKHLRNVCAQFGFVKK